ncbi:MAG TPA: 3'-5' exonuclease [Burkholderiales bacterium]
MAWLAQLFRPKVELPDELVRAIEAWRVLPESPDSAAIDETRFMVLDVETSGLDPRRDRLLSIGAVVVERMRLTPREAFNVVLRNQWPSTRENVVVHGLTPTRQAAGEIPERALGGFLEFVGKSPCVAFHADFDRIVLDRALRAELGVRLSNPWIDAARLAPILFPEARLVHGALDDWLAYFRLRAHTRHDAVHDAYATAEIFLILLARAGARGISTLAQLRAAAHAHERITTG